MTKFVLTFSSIAIISFIVVSCARYTPIRISRRLIIGRNYSNNKLYIKKYFAVLSPGSPVGKINSMGVDYALIGRFREAELLFKEVIKEAPGFSAAYNNLGIIYELFGNYRDAFKMYSRASIFKPENKYYRRNFLYLQGRRRKHTGRIKGISK